MRIKQFTGKVVIREVKRVLDLFFKVDSVRLSFEGFDGTMITPPFPVLSFERGDAVAALVHDVSTGELLLVEQFRYPTYAKSGGWTLEVVAGALEAGENPADAILRELLEEAGYEAVGAQHISTFYVSPGGTSERIMLYYIPITPRDEKSAGGGLTSQSENIRRHMVSVEDAIRMVEEGIIMDAKTICAIQWLQIRVLNGMTMVNRPADVQG